MNPSDIQRLIMSMDSSELKHYASQYYDPEKAHEYYLQNRQLKGRSTSGLSDEGKDVWNAAKANITSEKKNRIKEYKDQEEIDIKNLRDKAEATRKSISDKLKSLADALSKKFKNDNKGITDKIKAINKNSGLSKEQKAAKIEKLQAKRDKLSEDRKSESSKNSEEAKIERTKVGSDLKSAIQNARDTYSKNKKSLDDTYENIYQEEYDKIQSQYQSTKKRKKK